jgi:hypothetical protein
MFTIEDYNKWLKNPGDVELNKKMVEEFPFLLPKNRFSGEVSEDYDYTYTELDALEYGWKKAFGYDLLCELRDALVKANYLQDYFIAQIKEKYGTLRWYDFGAPEEAYKILRKYENLSAQYCYICGNPVAYETSGWINYVCEDCFVRHKLKGRLIIAEEETDETNY